MWALWRVLFCFGFLFRLQWSVLNVYLSLPVFDLDVPVVVSFPHFYLGDEKYHQDIDGVSPPVREEHQTYVDLNPVRNIFNPVMITLWSGQNS